MKNGLLRLPPLVLEVSRHFSSLAGDNDAAMWLNEAGKALYIAKNTARNKIGITTADALLDSVLGKPD